MQIGIDIEEIARFEMKTLENDAKFLNRIFSKEELEYCFAQFNPAQHLCARFCAKEAVIKALGDKKISLNKIKIINDKTGKPTLYLPEPYNEKVCSVSLAHCKNYACANVLIKN